jgi:hypothetical protein
VADTPQPQNNAYIFYHIRTKLSTEKLFYFSIISKIFGLKIAPLIFSRSDFTVLKRLVRLFSHHYVESFAPERGEIHKVAVNAEFHVVKRCALRSGEAESANTARSGRYGDGLGPLILPYAAYGKAAACAKSLE